MSLTLVFALVFMLHLILFAVFFFNDPATTEIYTRSIVGSVRCVQETDQRRVHGDISECLKKKLNLLKTWKIQRKNNPLARKIKLFPQMKGSKLLEDSDASNNLCQQPQLHRILLGCSSYFPCLCS
eukprot:TRINITY_DN53440_c0_g1_i2.p3 TRINITY_DN53440_c0_g1~~TRINITY_DN53440_c0_g1_i2.p3  ORF type:complete len:126 (+),score=22.97 TRINITY_DN53440_c0_g1_i2:70-447(+)